ncbi:Trm112p-domain-containing protein [Neoconidiobolus thromboides FSU 785]|nr:Trm112p-domain-containing protein [Neoconidiobolus thromboides FSU 785]
MRLLTHNMLKCNVKNCLTDNYPLKLEQVELESIDTEFNQQFIVNMLDRIDYDALKITAYQIEERQGLELGLPGLPESLPEHLDEDLLRLLHNILLETQIKSGLMVCNNCQHPFAIKDGIANMLLAEHEL